LILASFSTAFLCATPYLLLHEHSRASKWLAVALVSAIFFYNYGYARPEGFHEYSAKDFDIDQIIFNRLEVTSAREYRPKWAKKEPSSAATSILTLLQGDARWIQRASSPTSHLFQVQAQSHAVFRLNIHYFPGWKVWMNNQEIPIDFQNPYGLIDVRLPPGAYTLSVEFTNTPARRWGNFMSLAALGGLLVYCLSEVGLHRIKIKV